VRSTAILTAEPIVQSPNAKLAASPLTIGEGTAIGRYKLFRPLASGGMATVFLGWLEGEGAFFRPIAAKVMHPFALEEREKRQKMVFDEARIASRIRHTNVISVTDVVASDFGPVLIMDFVRGTSLSHLLTLSRYDVPLPIISRIAIDALEGLHAAHEVINDEGIPLQVVHRDVSPQNILVGDDGVASIVDFGIAKALERSVTTESGEVRGKFAYMAPEQFGSGPVDRRADIWGFGMVLRQLLARERPFADLDAASTVGAVLNGELVFPERPDAQGLVDVCIRALTRDRDRRYPTARLMAVDIEKAQAPASARDVAHWVKKIAGSVLRERQALVSEMSAFASRERSAPVAVSAAPAPVPTTAPESPGNRPASRSWRSVLVGGVLALAVATGGITALRRMRAPVVPVAPAGGAPTSLASGVPAPSISAAAREPRAAESSPTSTTSAMSATPSASAAPVASAPVAAKGKHAPGAARASSHSGTSSTRPTGPAPGGSVNVDPLAHDQRN
jgi:serine/threonine protein kinase